MPTLLLLLTLTLLPTAAHAVIPGPELALAYNWTAIMHQHAAEVPLPEPIEEAAVYYWTGTTWGHGAGPSGWIMGPDRDDYVIVMAFPPDLLTGNDDPRLLLHVSLVATFEDLVPTPEPGTWLLVGTGLAGLAISAGWGTSARRRAGGAPARR